MSVTSPSELRGGFLLIEEAAQRMGVSTWTMSEWCARGEFPNVKYPGKRRVYIPERDLAAYLAGSVELEMVRLPRGGRICRPVKPRR
jgi:excisionase family DNA binding protein